MNIFKSKTNVTSSISHALINKKKRKVPEPLIAIRQIEEKDIDEVKQLLHDHFNSLTIPAVVYWSIQHIYDLLVIIVINYIFFLDFKKILYFLIIFIIYLYIRAKLEFLRHIRKDCPDLENLYESYIKVEGCNFWVAEVFDNNYDSISRTTCSDIHERDKGSCEQEREEQSQKDIEELNDSEKKQEEVTNEERLHNDNNLLNELNGENDNASKAECDSVQPNEDSTETRFKSCDDLNTERTENDVQYRSTVDLNERNNESLLDTIQLTNSNDTTERESVEKKKEDSVAENENNEENTRTDSSTDDKEKSLVIKNKEYISLKDCNEDVTNSNRYNRLNRNGDNMSITNAVIHNVVTNEINKMAFDKLKDEDDLSYRYQNRRIVGCVGIVPYKGDDTIAQLVRMVVKKDNRRMRIGSRLLTQLENFAHEKNYKELKVFTNNLNTDSLYFVKQNGFNLSQIVRRGLMRGDLLIWSKILNKEEISKFNSLGNKKDELIGLETY